MLYTVKYGDSLISIAAAHHISPAALSAFNQLDPHTKPVIGQTLIIPDKSKPKRKIIIHGPVLPIASEAALSNIAPYLTYASVCSAHILSDGSIDFPNDASIVRHTVAEGIAPIMALSNKCEAALHNMLSNKDTEDSPINLLIRHLINRGYWGINLDISSVCAEDISAYSAFIRTLSNTLCEHNLALLISIYQSENLHSLPLECADYTIILPWEKENTCKHPAPVCPVGEMRQMIEHTAETLPTQKILLGIPAIGYNWKLSCHSDTAIAVYLNQAPILAYNNFADILYDNTAQAPHFSYYDSAGSRHMVWFHDPRSISKRLDLVEEYCLGGISVQNTAPLYRPGWLCLSEKHGTHKLI